MKDSEATVEDARKRDAYPHLVDGRDALDKASAINKIADQLEFPDWFGHNLDALYDCLTDLSWLPVGEHVLIWIGSDLLRNADPKAYLSIRGVLSDAQRALRPGGDRRDNRQLTVVLVDS